MEGISLVCTLDPCEALRVTGRPGAYLKRVSRDRRQASMEKVRRYSVRWTHGMKIDEVTIVG